MVDHVDDRLEDCGDDARTAGAAEHQNDPAIPLDQGRGHRRQRPLARRNRVGLALDQTVKVRRARLDGEVVHLIVEKKAGAGRHHASPEIAVDRIGHRDGVTFAVDDRIMGRLGFFDGR